MYELCLICCISHTGSASPGTGWADWEHHKHAKKNTECLHSAFQFLLCSITCVQWGGCSSGQGQLLGQPGNQDGGYATQTQISEASVTRSPKKASVEEDSQWSQPSHSATDGSVGIRAISAVAFISFFPTDPLCNPRAVCSEPHKAANPKPCMTYR